MLKAKMLKLVLIDGPNIQTSIIYNDMSKSAGQPVYIRIT